MSPVLTYFEPIDGSVNFKYFPRENTAYTLGTHRYREGSLGSGYSMELVIPPNTPTDFASIPRCFWWLWPKFGRWNRAALFHDEAYRRQNMKRRRADSIFIDMMEGDGVGWFSRHCLWAAVRCFGWYFWLKQKRKNEEEKA